jgi:hypothetical protein
VTGAAIPTGSVSVPGASSLHGLAFNAQGELFIADVYNNRLVRFTFDGEGNPVANGTIPVPGGPVDVAFSSAGELFVSTAFGGGLQRSFLDASGNAIPNGSIPFEHLGGVAIFDRSRLGWFDDFESYSAGSFPSANWTNSGNTQAFVEAGSGLTGSNDLKLFGVLGSCWGALAHREIPVQPAYEIQFYVRNGSEPLSGCHSEYGGAQLNTGLSWTTPGRRLIAFDVDDRTGERIIRGVSNTPYDPGDGVDLGHHEPGIWYKVMIRYERVTATTARLSYWINDVYKGSYDTPALPYENDLSSLSLWAGEGSAWFDDVSVSPASGQTFSLTLTKAGTGNGTVSSSPAGITCGSDCAEAYPAGTSVTVTATPDAGSAFTGWSVDGGACPALSADGLICTLGLTQARDVTAAFALQTLVNVDGKIRVTYSSLVLNRTTNTFDMWATVTNISQDSVLLAPMSLVITSTTPDSVTLANPTGQTADGKPFLAVPVPEPGLAPGQSVSNILMKFNNPTRVLFTFSSSVLAVDTR